MNSSTFRQTLRNCLLSKAESLGLIAKLYGRTTFDQSDKDVLIAKAQDALEGCFGEMYWHSFTREFRRELETAFKLAIYED